jgi:LacI family transcriptional regulator/LacI family purine nucleotide synthesis repressor
MCLFCDIAAHKFDANIVDETERTITFLDIVPANEGHVLIIPKLHVDSILDLPDEYVLEADYRNTAKAFNCTEQLLQLKNPPTCILYPDDFAAIGGIGAVHMLGLQVGKDVSVAGYDGIPIATRMHPPLTTLHQDTESMGRLAAERLISLIDTPRTTVIERIVVEGHIFPGGTVCRI